jgi:hypothetical protein
MLFCYHPHIVSKWKSLPGAPRNIRVPQKRWVFGKDVKKQSTNEQVNPPVTLIRTEQPSEKEENEDSVGYDSSSLRMFVPILEKGMSWADACDSDSD